MAHFLLHAIFFGTLGACALPLLLLMKRSEVIAVGISVFLCALLMLCDWWRMRSRRPGISPVLLRCVGVERVVSSGRGFVEYLGSHGFILASGIFSLLVPVIPVCGEGGVFTITLLWLMLWYVQASPAQRSEALSVRENGWIIPLAALVAGSVLYEVWFINESARHGVYSIGSGSLLSMVRSFFLSNLPSWPMLTRILVVAGCVRMFTLLSNDARTVVRVGFLLGTVACGVAVLAEFGNLFPWSRAAQSTFWSAQGRLSGLASDPNALGLWMALVTCAVWFSPAPARCVRYLKGVSCAVIPVAALLSGSRSFILGIGVVLIVFAYRRSRRLLVGSFAVLVCVVAAVSASDLVFPWIERLATIAAVPSGVRRGLLLLSAHHIAENLHSRTVFNQLGVELVRHFPYFGVGPDRFRLYVTALGTTLDMPLGRWVDNSNNFYLGVWAELGLAGVVALLYAIGARRLVYQPHYAAVGVVVLLVLLITGPHLDFPELAVLGAFLVAQGTAPRAYVGEGATRRVVVCGVGALLVGILSGSVREQGTYRCAFSEGICREWVAPGARFWMSCGATGERTLRIEAPHVSPKAGMAVTVEQPGEQAQEVRFTHSGVQDVTLRCGSHAPGDGQSLDDHTPESFIVSVWSRPGWSPARDGTKRRWDERWLGVRIEGRRAEDLLARSK